jgi:protein-tyrosine-phosphatase
MFEFRVDRSGGRHVLLEVNPRFWGSLPLAVAAGADFPALYWDLKVHGREGSGAYRAGVIKADLTGEFTRAVDRTEEAGGLAKAAAAASALVTAAMLLLARESADSWAADDPVPWREERLTLAQRVRAGLRKRLPGRERAQRTRFEESARTICGKAAGRPPRLLAIGRDNVCRSAFAERLLRLRLAGLPVEVASAGFVPRRGALPDATTLASAAQLGVDLGGHSSNALSVADLEQADALILFDGDTEWRLRQMSPGFTGEVITLPDLDIAGPSAFPTIAAGLSRLAGLLAEQLRPQTRPAQPERAPIPRGQPA